MEKDLIKEIINIGLAKAADSFAFIAKEKVLLNVPEVSVMDPSLLKKNLSIHKGNENLIKSTILGELNGKNFLILSNDQADRLAEVCLGKETEYVGNYQAIKKSLLLEISNIVTGALVTQLANILSLNIYGGVPSFIPAVRRQQEIMDGFDHSENFVLTVVTRFVNSGRVIQMPMVLVIDLVSAEKIVNIMKGRMKAKKGWLVS